MSARLTARGVKTMLSRAGVDRSELTIYDWADRVVITGPRDARMKAFHALFERGLACAPYRDWHEWSR